MNRNGIEQTEPLLARLGDGYTFPHFSTLCVECKILIFKQLQNHSTLIPHFSTLFTIVPKM